MIFKQTYLTLRRTLTGTTTPSDHELWNNGNEVVLPKTGTSPSDEV